jgi:hypothetical protein
LIRYCVNPIHVSHDRLQDEVIIINVANGAYYSGSGPAADVWTLITQGASIAEATNILASAYAIDAQLISSDLEDCVARLLACGLIESAITVEQTRPTLPELARNAWSTPAFDEYTDMWELIKLDPIHEVDDVGWPVARP